MTHACVGCIWCVCCVLTDFGGGEVGGEDAVVLHHRHVLRAPARRARLHVHVARACILRVDLKRRELLGERVHATTVHRRPSERHLASARTDDGQHPVRTGRSQHGSQLAHR